MSATKSIRFAEVFFPRDQWTRLLILSVKHRKATLKLFGVRFFYHRAARPNDELRRIEARAKFSLTHHIDPKAQKKDSKTAEARRMLTIMASRLSHGSLIVAENAATGRFLSLQPVIVKTFDVGNLGQRLNAAMKWERARKSELKRLA